MSPNRSPTLLSKRSAHRVGIDVILPYGVDFRLDFRVPGVARAVEDEVHRLNPHHPVVYRDAEDAHVGWLTEALRARPASRPWLVCGINAYTTRLDHILTAWPSRGHAALVVAGTGRRASELMIAVINRSGPLDLTLEIDGPTPTELQMYVTDPDLDSDYVGRLWIRSGRASLYVPARSVTTLTAAPAPVDEE
jgi:hypothetical protein